LEKRHQGGFSLVEILVVLVIMGLLISVVAPTVLNRADEARVQKTYADFKAIETALKIYRLDNYVYPTTEQGLEALWIPGDVPICSSARAKTARWISIRWEPMGSLAVRARMPT
jgi:type II secretion system protein G